ncbi:hypothetical protein PEC730217_32190 [Pectobacterium carotovorum subsp. carotovorum]|nr:hypothetical protein PEC730217_32190 [Pectobacterium carotovorum subsp. carotovorum]
MSDIIVSLAVALTTLPQDKMRSRPYVSCLFIYALSNGCIQQRISGNGYPTDKKRCRARLLPVKGGGETTFFMSHRVFLCSVDSHLSTYGAVVNIRISYYLSEFSPVVNVFNKK